jgi:hypothetical protein
VYGETALVAEYYKTYQMGIDKAYYLHMLDEAEKNDPDPELFARFGSERLWEAKLATVMDRTLASVAFYGILIGIPFRHLRDLVLVQRPLFDQITVHQGRSWHANIVVTKFEYNRSAYNILCAMSKLSYDVWQPYVELEWFLQHMPIDGEVRMETVDMILRNHMTHKMGFKKMSRNLYKKQEIPSDAVLFPI